MRRLPIAAATLLLTATAALTSCSDKSNPTPRMKGWPRLHIADSVYRPINAGGLSIEVNTAAKDSVIPSSEGSDWLNIVYPGYCNGSVIYCTITPVNETTRESVIDNRIERIALNLGSNEAEMTEITTPGGWHCKVIESVSPVVTPLQFIANDDTHVVTGAYYISETGDSVAPYIEAVRRDIIHLLKTIHTQ